MVKCAVLRYTLLLGFSMTLIRVVLGSEAGNLDFLWFAYKELQSENQLQQRVSHL